MAVTEIKQGLFLIKWNTSESIENEIVDDEFIPNYYCRLDYKLVYRKYVLLLKFEKLGTNILAIPDEIKSISAKKKGVQKEMVKIDDQDFFQASWMEPKLFKCVSCQKWPISIAAYFEIVIELKSFSANLTRTHKRLKSVHEAVKQIRENQALADVKFLCQNETITGHSTILSAGSSVLAAMFRHDFQEKQEMVVEITDITADVFKQLLQYLYTQDADLDNFEDVAGLFVAADKYNVDSLKEECEIHLSENLSSKNAVRCLVLGNLHNIPRLLESSMRYMAKNPRAILFSVDEWVEVMKNYPRVAFQVIESIITKDNEVSA